MKKTKKLKGLEAVRERERERELYSSKEGQEKLYSLRNNIERKVKEKT